MKTLKDVLPREAVQEKILKRHLPVAVKSENDGRKNPWPGKHKNVLSWWELSNGYAVGWNESPSRGWSFPTFKMQ
jgi:hypothetical protein